jgi:tetratricopeptide (TPR) repeat protein
MNPRRRILLCLLALVSLAGAALGRPSARQTHVFVCEHVSYEDRQAYLALPENSVERHLARGEGYHRRGQYQRACAEFRKGLAIDPTDARLYFHLGASHFSPRLHEQAVLYFRKALKLRPEMYMARGYLALSLSYLGRARESLAEFAASPRVPPTSAQQWNYAATLYFFRRNYQGAIDVATAGLRRFPKDGPYMPRGRAYMAQQRWKEAAADFTSQIEQVPAAAWAWSYRADCYDKLGRRAAAVADRQQFLRLNREVLK